MPASTMSSRVAEYGQLISVEGDAHLISTQLRLLPPSRKILILQSLLENLPEQIEDKKCDPLIFIRNVHTAFTERLATARSFLKAASNSQPRFVFMNGGTVAARSICISHISDNHTGGRVEHAEDIFNDIVKAGVSGLMQLNEQLAEEDVMAAIQIEKDNESHLEDSLEEDHTAKAMRAAESLDRKTADLQEPALDFIAAETRDTWVQNLQGSSWKSQSQRYTPRPRDTLLSTNDTVKTLVTAPKADIKDFEGTRPPSTISRLSRYDSYQSGLHGCELRCHRSKKGSNMSVVSMPQTVMSRDAYIIDAERKPGNQPRKAVSVDHLHLGDLITQKLFSDNERLQYPNPKYHLPCGAPRLDLLDTFHVFTQAQRAVLLGAVQIAGKIPPRMHLSLPLSLVTDKRIYIDRGTDAPEDKSHSSSENALFEPVFPLVEDLVIHFDSGGSNAILDSIILSYKSGLYPRFPDTLDTDASLNPMITTTNTEDNRSETCYKNAAKTSDENLHREAEFDPYSSNAFPWPRMYRSERTNTVLTPPTPAMTPRPVSSDYLDRFYTFSPLDIYNVIEVQNSLRMILSLYYPRGEESYKQQLFSVIPEADRLWKPVFGNSEDASSYVNNTADQIIAVGCEKGVKQEFLYQISGQVERLGMKRDGRNRSGRLDLWYFIALATQTLSSSSSSKESRVNHISESRLLAEILVPHIEAYLAVNNTVRLLILHYPADYLSTVLCLRTILGNKLFKIAGVLDSHACDAPLKTLPRTPSKSNPHPLSNEALAAHRLPQSYVDHHRTNSSFTIARSSTSPNTKSRPPPVSFSKADYPLHSIATNNEIATFLSKIRASLIEISSYYTPEPEPSPIIVEKIVERYIENKSLPPIPTSDYQPISHRLSITARNSTKIARLTGSEAPIPILQFSALEKGGYAPSIASTTMTMRTTGSRVWRTEDVGDGFENFYLEVEDSEDDDWDRMIMGRSGMKPPERTPEGKKGIVMASKKKALKWLGLA